MSQQQTKKQYLWVWFVWLGIFYAIWLWLVFGQGIWDDAIEHWPIALAMALGSYAAGSTPMGGGTVGFPVLVLLFDMPASFGRDFSFAVQSIGMTSASILIFARRQKIAMHILKGAVAGSLIGTPLGILFIAPYIPELWIKIIFSIVWASFGVLHFCRLNEISSHKGMTQFSAGKDFNIGFFLGILSGSTVVAVTGVGIDMAIYATLVLLCRADLKIAIPTSVIIMAFNSVLGIIVKNYSTGIQPGVYEHWLAAAPIVILGAPLGVLAVGILGRASTMIFVSILCVGQFIWTCYAEQSALGYFGCIMALAAVGITFLGFEMLRIRGAMLVYDEKAGSFT